MIEKDEIQEQELSYEVEQGNTPSGTGGAPNMPSPQSEEKKPAKQPNEGGEQGEGNEGQQQQPKEQEQEEDDSEDEQNNNSAESLKQVHTLNFIDKNFSGINSNFKFAYKYIFGQTFADVFSQLLSFSDSTDGGYVFSEAKIRDGSLTLEQWIQVDKDCLKMVVLKIKNNPDHFGEDGVKRFTYDKLANYLDSCLPPTNHTIFKKGTSNLKPEFTIFYLGGNKYGMIDYDYHSKGQNITDSLVFERDDEAKQLIPISFFNRLIPNKPDNKEYLKTGSFYLLINIVSLFDKKNKSYVGIEENPTPVWSFTSFIELYNSI